MRFPLKIDVPGTAVYEIDPTHCVVHGELPRELRDAVVADFEEDRVRVLSAPPGEVRARAGVGAVTPAYRIATAGPLAAPTGRILVRLREGEGIAARAADLDTAGYRLIEALSYAPHAGWVTARTDDVADSLGGMARLREIPGVEHVEPQMLTARASR